MSSSKIILVGAIAVVFGLYSLSLIKVEASLGNTAENSVYIGKATDNAKTGSQRAFNLWSRGNDIDQSHTSWRNAFVKTESFMLIDGSFIDTVYVTSPLNFPASYSYNSGTLVKITIISHGYYKAPNEPASFSGHEVIRTLNAQFNNTDLGSWPTPWYDVKFLSSYTTVNYVREHQLDSLQAYKSNLIGY